MIFKVLGALLIIAGCGGCGLAKCRLHRKDVYAIREFIKALEYMECELQCRLTPLPSLCRNVISICDSPIREVFETLSEELDNQICPNAELCLEAALLKCVSLPKCIRKGVSALGKTLGVFDVEGQMKELQSVRNEYTKMLSSYTDNEDNRMRSYQTIGLCAGIAIAIILF